MIRVQDGGDPIWGPFIYDGDESDSLKRFQETIFVITPHQGDNRGESIEPTAICDNDGYILETRK